MIGNKAFWTDRKVLITGATGFLGGWLTQKLLDLGADVVCIIRDWVPGSSLIKDNLVDKINVVRGDICDHYLMERVIGEYEIQTVFHLAAQTIVGIANRNPRSTFESNLNGTVSVFEACRRSPEVKQIVFASSDKAYGEHEILPYSEDAPLHGSHPYDVSKTCGDLIAQSYAKTFNLPVVITRCGNFFGGGDLNWNRIVPGTIRSILKNEPPVIRSNGKYIRDYIYIEDGAEAYIHLAEKLSENPSLLGEAFNFSNESQVTVLELVEKILKLMNSDLTADIRNEANNEIKNQYLSAQKARDILQWKPQYGIEEGLRRSIEWYKNYLGEGR